MAGGIVAGLTAEGKQVPLRVDDDGRLDLGSDDESLSDRDISILILLELQAIRILLESMDN